ncbi:MAG: hypothetical protein ACYC6G_09975 [Desulfobaccales bacterium]
MFVKLLKNGRFLLTAGLLVVLVQGLVRLPDLQDYFFPDNYWELKVQSIGRESWHIENDLTSLRLRVGYLEWFLSHKDSPQSVSMKWMVHFPISECIRINSPKFFWSLNIYLAYQTKVKVQRKLKNLGALFNNIPLNKKQQFSRNYNDILLDDKEFDKKISLYAAELDTLSNKLDNISKVSYQ